MREHYFCSRQLDAKEQQFVKQYAAETLALYDDRCAFCGKMLSLKKAIIIAPRRHWQRYWPHFEYEVRRYGLKIRSDGTAVLMPNCATCEHLHSAYWNEALLFRRVVSAFVAERYSKSKTFRIHVNFALHPFTGKTDKFYYELKKPRK